MSVFVSVNVVSCVSSDCSVRSSCRIVPSDDDNNTPSCHACRFVYFISNIICINTIVRNIFFHLISFIRYFRDHHTHKIIPPGVNDDNDDDGATEVQTNFVSSQYFVTITTNSKIIILTILVVVIVAGNKIKF